ncbi:hypothetical protein EDD85DRAFT_943587 [Armillaria nabsnona]|nr:hypothetical protein EDD85DRAFT_943587 [Armillaria nabsnona]
MQAVSSNLRLTIDSLTGFTIAKAIAASEVKIYITRRMLDVLTKAAASVTGVPGSIVSTQMDVRRRKHQAGAKHIEEIDRKFDVLVNKLVCRALRSSRPYTDAFSPGFAGPAFQTTSQKTRAQKNPLNPKQYRAGRIRRSISKE